MPTYIAIPANRFAELSNATIEEAGRYYLKGVHLSPGPENSILMAATTGHILSVRRIPADECHGAANLPAGGLIVPAEKPLIQACRSKGKYPLPVSIRLAVSLTATGAVESVAVTVFNILADQAATPGSWENPVFILAGPGFIDASYPDFRRVIPKAANLPAAKDGAIPGRNHTSWDAAALCVNPKLLETLARSAGAEFVQILPEADPGNPRLVMTSDSNWQGVVMLASAESIPSRPGRRPWLNPATEATENC